MAELTLMDRQMLDAAQARVIEQRVKQGIATRSDHARRAIRRSGRRVRCENCGERTRVRTWRGRRLRHFGCPDCGGRLRPETWPGFAELDGGQR